MLPNPTVNLTLPPPSNRGDAASAIPSLAVLATATYFESRLGVRQLAINGCSGFAQPRAGLAMAARRGLNARASGLDSRHAGRRSGPASILSSPVLPVGAVDLGLNLAV